MNDKRKLALAKTEEAFSLLEFLRTEPKSAAEAIVARRHLDKMMTLLDEIKTIAEEDPDDPAFKYILDTIDQKRAQTRSLIAINNAKLAN